MMPRLYFVFQRGNLLIWLIAVSVSSVDEFFERIPRAPLPPGYTRCFLAPASLFLPLNSDVWDTARVCPIGDGHIDYYPVSGHYLSAQFLPYFQVISLAATHNVQKAEQKVNPIEGGIPLQPRNYRITSIAFAVTMRRSQQMVDSLQRVEERTGGGG